MRCGRAWLLADAACRTIAGSAICHGRTMSPTDPIASDPAARLARRRRLTRGLALLTALLMLGVIGLSAFIRLAQTPLAGADFADAIAIARAAHRVSASALLVLAFMLLATTLLLRPVLRRAARLASGIVACTLWLAALGMASRGSTAPAVVLGNLLGGFAMFALCLRLALASRDDAAGHGGLRRPAGWALLALLLAIVLGALASATALPPSCDGWRECLEAARVAGWDWQIVNPWFAPTAGAGPGLLPRDAWLQLLHRGAGLLALLTLLRLDWAAWRQRAHAGTTPLAVLVALELLLLASALLPVGLAQALAHNLAAALLLGWLARWA